MIPTTSKSDIEIIRMLEKIERNRDGGRERIFSEGRRDNIRIISIRKVEFMKNREICLGKRGSEGLD